MADQRRDEGTSDEVKRWTPLDWIALALVVILGSVMATPMRLVWATNAPLPPESLEVLEQLTTGLLTIVSMYVGAAMERRRK